MAWATGSCHDALTARLARHVHDFYKLFTTLCAILTEVAHNEPMQPTVLIVEDAETCASILEIIVETIDGLQVATASSGDQAWEMLEKEPEPIRAIVTDLHMSGMDGFELMQRVRAHHVHSRVPIIVITGCTDPDAPQRARLNGANAVFLKPYSPARVREKLEQLLSDEPSSD